MHVIVEESLFGIKTIKGCFRNKAEALKFSSDLQRNSNGFFMYKAYSYTETASASSQLKFQDSAQNNDFISNQSYNSILSI